MLLRKLTECGPPLQVGKDARGFPSHDSSPSLPMIAAKPMLTEYVNSLPS